jgi:hypothetical protein
MPDADIKGQFDHEPEGQKDFDPSDARPTAFDLAKKIGLIGAVRSNVGDLSANPKHFDGFGK